MTDTVITELLAKQAITEALYKYCRAMDRMDNELGKSVFHVDASRRLRRDVPGYRPRFHRVCL